MRRTLIAAGLLLAGGLGFFGGARVQRPEAPPLSREGVEVAGSPAPALALLGQLGSAGQARLQADEVRAAVRQVLKEEIKGLRAAAGPGEPAPPDAASFAALEAGQELVQAAQRSRRWTQRQAEELRAQLVSMTDEQRLEVARSLVPAINRGEIAVEFPGPPL